MTICYFGDYDSVYARNRVIINGLKKNNVQVSECNIKFSGFKKIIKIFLSRKILNKSDLIIVGYSNSRTNVFLAKLFCHRPIIWDAFYSNYDMWVNDRKLTKKISLKALWYWFGDWINCIFSDKILLDTNEHIKYFVKLFKIKKDKFIFNKIITIRI